MNAQPYITFDNDNETKKAILKAFDMKVDKDNIIISSKTNQPALTREGLEVTLDRFWGFWPGSQLILRNDIVSMMDFAEYLKTQKRK